MSKRWSLLSGAKSLLGKWKNTVTKGREFWKKTINLVKTTWGKVWNIIKPVVGWIGALAVTSVGSGAVCARACWNLMKAFTIDPAIASLQFVGIGKDRKYTNLIDNMNVVSKWLSTALTPIVDPIRVGIWSTSFKNVLNNTSDQLKFAFAPDATIRGTDFKAVPILASATSWGGGWGGGWWPTPTPGPGPAPV